MFYTVTYRIAISGCCVYVVRRGTAMSTNLKANVNAEGSKLFHSEQIADKSPKHYKITSYAGYAILSEVKHIEDKNWTFSYRNKGKNASTMGATVSEHTVTQLGRTFIKPGSRYAIGRVNSNDIIIIFDEELSSGIYHTTVGQITFNKPKKDDNNMYDTFIKKVHKCKTPA